MRQHSNREPYTPWGEPVRHKPDTPAGWWTPLLTVPALVRHLVVMFTVMAVVSTINLLTTPATWWALALLVIWVAVLIIHGLGIASSGILLESDESERALLPHVDAKPQNGKVSSVRAIRHKDEPQSAVPPSWELKEDSAPDWPSAPPPQPDEKDEPQQEEPAAEQGSWRAVTDIAWLRQSRSDEPRSDNGRSDHTATRRDQEASS